jgi:hypothetical protein
MIIIDCRDEFVDLPRALWVRLTPDIFGFPFGRDCLK